MTLKACILGDSHTAKLIMALREDDNPLVDTKFDRVAGSGPGISVLKMIDGVFTSTNKRGQQIFEDLGDSQPGTIHDYDYFIITGSGFGLGSVVSTLREGDLWTDDQPQNWFARRFTAKNHNSRQLISRSCLKAGIRAQFNKNAYINFAKQISNETKAHIFITPQPRPSDRLHVLDSRRNMPVYWRVARSSVAAEVEIIYTETVKDFMAEIPSLTLLLQPPQTTSGPLCTNDDFMAGAAKLSNLKTTHNKRDFIHGNTAYGQLQLTQIREARDKLNLFSDFARP
jgi:hypothetical protein